MRRRAGTLIGLLGALFVLAAPVFPDLARDARVVLAVTVLMASFWIGEVIPIAATALIPMAVFPLAAVRSTPVVARAYMHPLIVLFMGGFFLAMAIQKWNLHRRIALHLISTVGRDLDRVVLGFMLAAALLSMWVSNTATTLMMFPIGTAVIVKMREIGLEEGSSFPTVLMLGIAYGASIGGVGTLIGTPPNLVFAAQLSELYPNRPPVTFARWMMVGVPFVVVFLPLCWWYLTRAFSSLGGRRMEAGLSVIHEEITGLGRMSAGEKGVGTVFVLTALGWIFRENIDLGFAVIPGWAPALGVESFVHDATVAILASLVLFLTPVDPDRGEYLLDWEWASRIPWGILILFGGGIALADGFEATGLAAWTGEKLTVVAGLPVMLLVLVICLMVTFLTEVTSNTASSTILMPVLGALATRLGVGPELFMIPGAISATCAFMLPVATPPNAIVFGSEEITMLEMSRAGLALNLLAAGLTTGLVYLLAGPVFGVLP